MAPPSLIHVRFVSRYGWTVEREGIPAPLSSHCAQSVAERVARSLAQRERGRIYVHNLVGDVIRSDSYVP